MVGVSIPADNYRRPIASTARSGPTYPEKRYSFIMHVLRPCALILALAAANTALGEPSHRRHQARDDANDRGHSYRDERGGKRAVRDVIGEVEHNYRGQVIDVRPPRADDDMYRVRVLQEGGRVKTLRVPANRDKERGGKR